MRDEASNAARFHPRWLIAMLVGTCFASRVWAGPPFVTDDPEPVGYGHWEVNYGISKTWRDDSVSAALPSVDVNYGVLPNVQLHAQPRYSYEKSSGRRHVGIDDTEIGVKYRFAEFHSGGTAFAAGIYPMLQLPTGDKQLGDGRGKLQSFLPLWLQMSQDTWVVYGGVGYRINHGVNNRNSIFSGIVGLVKVSEVLQVGGEVFQETADVAGTQSSASFNIGGIYNLVANYNLLFSTGRGIKSAAATNRQSAYVALQVLR
jgi:hypothetical protein